MVANTTRPVSPDAKSQISIASKYQSPFVLKEAIRNMGSKMLNNLREIDQSIKDRVSIQVGNNPKKIDYFERASKFAQKSRLRNSEL